ncbi:MAG: SDR family NAD(P)-dependent oxidoreductase [Proteobacteria bacterium]|nr:SDR family NAD(P)-dependent oxidoreductase [Burkholderiales bacterium]
MLEPLRLPQTFVPAPDCLRERVIVVTGSGAGVGRATALACARHGAHVVLHGRRQKKLEALFDEIVATGAPEPTIVALDLARATDLDFAALADAIGVQYGRLDGIVHCAVHLDQLRPLDDEPIDRWLAMFRVNLIATAALNRACQPLLRAAADASVVVTVETHALAPSAFWGSFALAKQALLGLTAIQAQEWRTFAHLRIDALLPGPIASPQRGRTHPAEDGAHLRSAAAIAPGYLYLLGTTGRGGTGRLLDMTPEAV